LWCGEARMMKKKKGDFLMIQLYRDHKKVDEKAFNIDAAVRFNLKTSLVKNANKHVWFLDEQLHKFLDKR
jgi:hypothetical protein